jgi:hypothetical protein
MKKFFLISIITLVLSSCASTIQYTNSAKSNGNNNEFATIYIVRPSIFGSAIKFGIYQDGQLIGKLGPKSYLAWNVKPEGKEIIIMSKSENKNSLAINPQAGKNYFIKQKAKMGLLTARTKLEFIDENDGLDILKKLKLPKSKLQ